MLLRIVPEDRERFLVVTFGLQLSSKQMHLQRTGEIQGLLLRGCGLVFAIERCEDF